MKNNGKVSSIKSRIDKTAMRGLSLDLTREEIKADLQRDIRGVYVLLAEMLNTDEVLNAITDVFYERYVRLKAKAVSDLEAAPELPLKNES